MLSRTARDYKHRNPGRSSGFTISLEVYGQLILHLRSNSLPQDAMPGAQSDGRQTTLPTQLLPKLNARPKIMSATEYCRPQTKVNNIRPMSISSSKWWKELDNQPQSVDSQKSLGLRLSPHTEKGWCYTAHDAVQQLSQDDHVNADIQGYFGKPCWRMDMPMLIVLSQMATRMQRIILLMLHPSSRPWQPPKGSVLMSATTIYKSSILEWYLWPTPCINKSSV